MNHRLYFVPILADALGRPDRRQSLEKAFEAIERLGQEPGYSEGYQNFCRFMAEVSMGRRLLDEQGVRTAAVEMVAGIPTQAKPWETFLLQLIETAPWLKDECEALSRACGSRPRAFSLQLLREGRRIAELPFETARSRRTASDIHPGHYVLRLDIGLGLWEGTLTAGDVLWAEAFGGEALALAAEADEVRRRPSRELKVSDAGLVLRVFPGVESGSLEIERTA
jgi:hypothetical protein